MARKKKGAKSKQRSRLKEFSKLKEKQRIILANNTQQSRPPSSSPEANITPPYIDETTSLLTRSTKTPVPEESTCGSSNNGQSSIAISNLRTLVAPIQGPESANSNDTAATTYACVGKPNNLFGSSSALENNNKDKFDAISTLRFVSSLVCINSTLFLAAMDTSLILDLFGLLSGEFEQLPQGSWMISACFLTTAICFPLYRKLRPVIGDLLLLQLSLFALLLGCLISSLAPNFVIFLLGRSISGIGLGSSLLIPFFPLESQRSKQYAQIHRIAPCITIVFGTIAGTISAGLLTEFNSFRWRSAFMAEAAVALAFIPWVQCFLIYSPMSTDWRGDLKTIRWSKFNAYAFILLCASAPTIFEVRQASGLLVAVVSSVVLLCVVYAFFRMWKPSTGKPRRGTFNRADNRCAAIRILLASIAISATFTYISLYFSIVDHLPPMQVGLRIIPGVLNIVLSMIIVDKLLKVFIVDIIRYIAGLIAFVGTLCLVFLPNRVGTFSQFSLCVLPAAGLTTMLIATARASHTAAKVSPLVQTAGFSIGVCWAGLLFHSVLWKQLVKQLSVFEETGIARDLLDKYAVNAYYSSKWALNESPTLVRSAFINSYTNSCKSVSILTLACIVLAIIV